MLQTIDGLKLCLKKKSLLFFKLIVNMCCRYFQLMEAWQENLAERQQLIRMAGEWKVTCQSLTFLTLLKLLAKLKNLSAGLVIMKNMIFSCFLHRPMLKHLNNWCCFFLLQDKLCLSSMILDHKWSL